MSFKNLLENVLWKRQQFMIVNKLFCDLFSRQTFHDKNLSYKSLPSALRKVMVAKFPDFDTYQLGKRIQEAGPSFIYLCQTKVKHDLCLARGRPVSREERGLNV